MNPADVESDFASALNAVTRSYATAKAALFMRLSNVSVSSVTSSSARSIGTRLASAYIGVPLLKPRGREGLIVLMIGGQVIPVVRAI